MNKINIQILNETINNEVSKVHDIIEVEVDEAFLQNAQTCIDFMLKHNINYMCSSSSFNYRLYERAENLDEGEMKDKVVIHGNDGNEYIEFEPEYSLDGCHARIYQDGDIQVVLPLKNGGHEFFYWLGKVADLKIKIASAASLTGKALKVSGYDSATLFMQELMAEVGSLIGIANKHGARTLADLFYLYDTILSGGFIDCCQDESKVLEIVQGLPSGELWTKFIKVEYMAKAM
jgi:hypothetical protein